MAGRPREFDKGKALEKALKTFQEKGYEGASLDDLCTAMGIQRPSLYKAFGNKEQLFLSALQVYRLNFEARVEQVLESEEDGIVAIRKLLTMLGDIHTQSEKPTGCLVVNTGIACNSRYPNITNEISTQHQLREEMIAKRLRQAGKDGQLRRETNPEKLAQYINGVLLGMAALARGQSKPEAIHSVITMTNLTLDHV